MLYQSTLVDLLKAPVASDLALSDGLSSDLFMVSCSTVADGQADGLAELAVAVTRPGL